MTQDLNSRTRAGIVIGIKPTTGKRYRVELQRSTQSSTSSTNWTSVFLDPTSQGFSYRDELPLSTRTYYYRARQYGAGSTNSSYSATVSAKPMRFPEVWRDLPLSHNNLGNVEVLSGDVWVSSAKTIKVGTQNTAATITKVIRLHAAEFVPYSSAANWEYAGTFVRPSTTAATAFFAPVVLPKGVTITNVLVRWYKAAHPADSIDGTFQRIMGDGSSTLLTLTTTSTGWHNTGGSLTQLVGDEGYTFQVNMDANSSALDVRLQYVEVTYTVPSYDKAY
jgi:hypothetical protein